SAWKTKPRSRVGRRTALPETTTEPPEVGSRPWMARSSVVLPLPLGPTTVTNSPARMLRSMPSRTFFSWPGKRTHTPLRSSSGASAVLAVAAMAASSLGVANRSCGRSGGRSGGEVRRATCRLARPGRGASPLSPAGDLVEIAGERGRTLLLRDDREDPLDHLGQVRTHELHGELLVPGLDGVDEPVVGVAVV